MSWTDRADLYKKIEAHRKRPLIVYVTSKRNGVIARMADDALPFIIEQIDALPKDVKAVDFLIASYGGDPMMAWRIMTLLRERVEDVAVMIPQSAYSAATLLAFGANEIIMHPNGHLGPVDMQISTHVEGGHKVFSTEDISAFLDFVRDTLKITDQEHIRALFEMTCKEVGSLGIGFTARSSRLAIDLGERLLSFHIRDDDRRSELRSMVENMSRKFQSHNYPVSRTEALELGLQVNEKRDAELEQLMWNAWLNLESEMKEREQFNYMMELLNSAEASKLLSPVPQLDIPISAFQTQNWTTTLEDLKKGITSEIKPVDFRHVTALIDSSRLSYAKVANGKILSSRKIDLTIDYNILPTSNRWEKECSNE